MFKKSQFKCNKCYNPFRKKTSFQGRPFSLYIRHNFISTELSCVHIINMLVEAYKVSKNVF